jgi:hypothetical protein
MHTARFGIAVPPWAVTCTQSPVPGSEHWVPPLSQKAWQVPNTHESPRAQPAVAVHGFPIVALPKATHVAVPFVSTTSHVSVFAHPHWGETPHAWLGAAVLQLLGDGCSSAGGSSVSIGVEAGSFSTGSSSSAGVDGSAVLSANPLRGVCSALHARSAISGTAKRAARIVIAPRN